MATNEAPAIKPGDYVRHAFVNKRGTVASVSADFVIVVLRDGRRSSWAPGNVVLEELARIAPPVAASPKANSCARCGVPRAMACGMCADCWLLEKTEVASPKAGQDAYELHRYQLEVKFDSATPELDVGYETSRLPSQKAARLRNVATLRAEMSEPLSARRARLEAKFGPTPASDWSVFSTSGWES